jgi:hypothetical protein
MPEERLYFQQTILGRVVAYHPFCVSNEPNSAEKLIAECLERLRFEGNTHLLRVEEVPQVIQEVQRRLELLERSRIRRAIYDIRQRSRFGRLIYPSSQMQRVMYRIRYLLGRLRYKIFS